VEVLNQFFLTHTHLLTGTQLRKAFIRNLLIHCQLKQLKGDMMLVLSRHLDEKIYIQAGEKQIEVTVVKISPTKVRLGIEADTDVQIVRSELLQSESIA